MPGISKRPKLTLTPDELRELQQLRQSKTAAFREVQRARIISRYHAGETVAQIARKVQMTRKSVAKWITRALAIGPKAALKDTYHRPKEPTITEEARAWVVHLACIKPKELGYCRRSMDAQCVGPACAHSRRGGGASVFGPSG